MMGIGPVKRHHRCIDNAGICACGHERIGINADVIGIRF